MIPRRCWWPIVLLGLSACAMDLVSPPHPQAALPDHSPNIQLGQTRRTEVRALLGEPRFSSAAWGFDLFRADTEQHNVVVAVTPWPVPFARITDQLQRYTLVAYDGAGRASVVTTGLFRRPPAWRNVSPITADFPALHLRAADLMFFVDPEGARRENLLLTGAGRDAFLQRAPGPGGCLLVLGCGDRGCPDQLALDGAPARRLPLRTAHAYWLDAARRGAWLQGVEVAGGAGPWLETLVALRLGVGEHRLDFSARYLGGSHALHLNCQPGERRYLVIDAAANAGVMNRSLVDWQVDRQPTQPDRFARRPLVLLDDGVWQVDPEPRP